MTMHLDTTHRRALRIFRHPAFLWTVFVLVVCCFCLRNYYDANNLRAGDGQGPYEEKASAEIMLMGRYCMGMKSIYTDFPGLTSDMLLAGLLQQIKSLIRSKTDQVSLIPFVAEFAEPSEIFEYIDELRNLPTLSPVLTSDVDQFEMLYRFGAGSLSPEVHRRLIKRYRWIGQMALTFGLPPDNPDRALAMKPAVRTFFSALTIFGAISIGGLCGLVLFVVSIVMYIKKRFTSAIDVTVQPLVPLKRHVYLETTVVFLTLALLMSSLSSYLYPPFFWCIYILVAGAAMFWPVWRGIPFVAMRRAIGWHRGNGLVREAVAGLLGYLAGLPLVACGFTATFYIIQYTGANPVHPIVHRFENAAVLNIVALVALASIMAPIVEETIFRGALYRHLRFKHSAVWSVLTSAFVFAVIHPQGLAALPALGAIGAVLAILREWRGSLIAPMVAHALNNFVVTMMLAFALLG